MKTIYLLLIAIILVFRGSDVQSQPKEILEKTADKIFSFKNISFESSTVNTNPFSSGDTSYIKSDVVMVFNNQKKVSSIYKHFSINNEQTVFKEISVHDSLYFANLSDSTYTVKALAGNMISSDLTDLAELIRNQMLKKPGKLIQKPDTLINGINCYNFLFKLHDTILKENHNYSHKTISISKKDLLPLYVKDTGAGIMEKGGIVIGRVKIFNELHYSRYRVNQKIDQQTFVFNKLGFYKPNDKMLNTGDTAPGLNLKDLNDREIATENFKNKLLLLEFGSTGCPANSLVNPMLNRLHKKYSGDNVLILSIYTNEGQDQVKKYIASNNIEFPVYLGSKTLPREFKTLGTPNFYLIDKDGKVLAGIDGYSGSLESAITKKIDALLSDH